jgi:hypothetical protein
MFITVSWFSDQVGTGTDYSDIPVSKGSACVVGIYV